MKKKFPLNEQISIETLLEIAAMRFPEYKSYTQTFMIGKCVCINKNALFRAVVKVNHNQSKSTTTLVVNEHVTVLGSLLAGPIWGRIIFGDFFKEVEDVFVEEIGKRCL